MIEYIGVVIGIVGIIALAIVGYYLYKRIGSQQGTIEALIMRQRYIDAIISRPPPRQEVASLFESTSNCENCTLSPFPREHETESSESSEDNISNHVLLQRMRIASSSEQVRNSTAAEVGTDESVQTSPSEAEGALIKQDGL